MLNIGGLQSLRFLCVSFTEFRILPKWNPGGAIIKKRSGWVPSEFECQIRYVFFGNFALEAVLVFIISHQLASPGVLLII